MLRFRAYAFLAERDVGSEVSLIAKIPDAVLLWRIAPRERRAFKSLVWAEFRGDGDVVGSKGIVADAAGAFSRSVAETRAAFRLLSAAIFAMARENVEAKRPRSPARFPFPFTRFSSLAPLEPLDRRFEFVAGIVAGTRRFYIAPLKAAVAPAVVALPAFSAEL